MKPIVSFFASWILFILGDIVSRIGPYRWYQPLMCSSYRVQGWGGKGPWKVAT